MKIFIKVIENKELKSDICENILRRLPEWFGIESAILDYTNEVQEMPFYAVFDDEQTIGFVAIKVHNEYTAEIYVMGILEEYHRKGLGKMLISTCVQYCRDANLELLTVKTLDESRTCESYERTRHFYLAMGFRPLEVFKTLWDESNPCLFMVKYIK